MTLKENEWFIEAPWGRICIVAWGHCHNPPVLVCHGRNDSAASFRPLVKLLPRNFYYIGVELPGNGRSDPFPPGLLFNFYDLVFALEVVARHFRWESFVFLGHSVGAGVGMLFDFCFPGKITKSILIDPINPAVEPEKFANWYKKTYQAHFDDYDFYNSPKFRRPILTRKEAISKLMKASGISEDLAEEKLQRVSEDVGNGLVRLTFDRRYKVLSPAPLSPNQLKDLCLKSKTQVLLIATKEFMDLGIYNTTPFLLDEGLYDRTLRVRNVEGHHNVHSSQPESVAGFVGQFLLHGPDGVDSKAKL